MLTGDLCSLLSVLLCSVHPDLCEPQQYLVTEVLIFAAVASSPWTLVLIRALKDVQEGQLPPRLLDESRVVLASRVVKYGTRLTSQVRTKMFLE